MVPGGVGEARLQEAGFMFNQEKGVWYHQGTEFGRRKAENEEKSVEKLVNYLEVNIHVIQDFKPGGRHSLKKLPFIFSYINNFLLGVKRWWARCRSQ